MSEKSLINGVFSDVQSNDVGAMSAALDIFQTSSANEAIQDSHIMHCSPRPFTSDSTSIVIDVAAGDGQYLYLNDTTMNIVAQVQRMDGAKLKSTENVSLVTLFPYAIWATLEVDLNNKTIPGLGNSYLHLKHYIEHVLTFNKDVRESRGITSGFFLNTPGKHDTVTLTANLGDKNEAYNQMNEMLVPSGTSAEIQADGGRMGSLMSFKIKAPGDMFNIFRVLPPGTRLTLTYTMNKQALFMMYPTESVTVGTTVTRPPEYRTVFKSISLDVRVLRLNERLQKAHELQYEKNNCSLHHFPKTEFVKTSFSPNTDNTSINSLFNGWVPKQFIVILIDQDSSSSPSKNPFKFVSHQLSCAQAIVSPGTYVPSIAYNLTTMEGHVQAYSALQDWAGLGNSEFANSLTLDAFKRGSTMLLFNLSSDDFLGVRNNQDKSAKVDLILNYKENLKKALDVYVWCLYDATLVIDQGREAWVAKTRRPKQHSKQS